MYSFLTGKHLNENDDQEVNSQSFESNSTYGDQDIKIENFENFENFLESQSDPKDVLTKKIDEQMILEIIDGYQEIYVDTDDTDFLNDPDDSDDPDYMSESSSGSNDLQIPTFSLEMDR